MTPNKLLAPASGEKAESVLCSVPKNAPSLTVGFLPKTVTSLLTQFVSNQLLSRSFR